MRRVTSGNGTVYGKAHQLRNWHRHCAERKLDESKSRLTLGSFRFYHGWKLLAVIITVDTLADMWMYLVFSLADGDIEP